MWAQSKETKWKRAIYNHGQKSWDTSAFFHSSFSQNHGQKSWDTSAFLGRFPIHTGPNPPLTPQTMLDACIQNFFRVSTLYRVEGRRSARKFRKWCTVLGGNQEMTEKYAYCSTVPRTFVQDCSFPLASSDCVVLFLFVLIVLWFLAGKRK